MTNTEFSNEFDVLYNSITSNQAPGLDEYEKSVFLTKAQSDIIREYFNSRVDGTDGGFDGSQKRQYDFSQLITVAMLSAYNTSTVGGPMPLNPNASLYMFPEDYFLSVNEGFTVAQKNGNPTYYSVIAISYSDYEKLMQKPYPYPPKKSVWRVFTNALTKSSSGKTITVPVAEVLGKFPTSNNIYKLRYVKKPSPIVLIDISDEGLTIDGVSAETSCTLPPQLHKEILERAVTLAKIAYQAGTTSTLANQGNKQQQ